MDECKPLPAGFTIVDVAAWGSLAHIVAVGRCSLNSVSNPLDQLDRTNPNREYALSPYTIGVVSLSADHGTSYKGDWSSLQ